MMLTGNLYISQIPRLSHVSLDDVSKSSKKASKSPPHTPRLSLPGGSLLRSKTSSPNLSLAGSNLSKSPARAHRMSLATDKLINSPTRSLRFALTNDNLPEYQNSSPTSSVKSEKLSKSPACSPSISTNSDNLTKSTSLSPCLSSRIGSLPKTPPRSPCSSISKSPPRSPTPSLTGGNLSDYLTAASEDDSLDFEQGEEEESSWRTKLRFILTCLSYTVGLGNVWRFPYLVYRNGGGAFFIPYFVILLLCGVPLVFMEMAFGQYASLGPITIWKAVPLFKGIGYAMMIIQAVIAIYYNMVNAWAFYYLFASMNAPLPWSVCGHDWNSEDCREDPVWLSNCSWINETYLHQVNETVSQCGNLLKACIRGDNQTVVFSASNVTACISWLEGQLGDGIYLPQRRLSELKEASEEYFYNKVLARSEGLQSPGDIQWQLALCLLLCWIIVFLCLLRGVYSSGKLSYSVVIVAFLFLLVLLIQAVIIDGHQLGIKMYVIPDWDRLLDLQVWVDAASQVFFSLSLSAGGLCAIASYNSFYNNIYRDAVIVCVVDTIFSIMAGFLVFSCLGILANDLNTTVANLLEPNVGFIFVVFPAAVDHFDLPLIWSIIFFIMILLMGLSTTITVVETVVTAIQDEFNLLRTKSLWRIVVLSCVCCVLFVAGLPLTTRAGLYLVQLLDEFCSGFPLLVTGFFLCSALAWLFNVHQFCRDIRQMIGTNVSKLWKVMWMMVSPAVILAILVLYIVKGIHLDSQSFPDWSPSIGIILTVISVIPIPVYIIQKLIVTPGTLRERFHQACESADDWGPSIVTQHVNNIDFYPTLGLSTQSTGSGSLLESPIMPRKKRSSDMVTHAFPNPKSLDHTSYFSFPGILSVKKSHLDIRHRAILNQAFCASNGSIDKLPQHVTINESPTKGTVTFITKKVVGVDSSDKAIQTDARSYIQALKTGKIKPKVHKMTIEEPVEDKKSSHRKADVKIEQQPIWSDDDVGSNNKHAVEVEVQVEHL